MRQMQTLDIPAQPETVNGSKGTQRLNVSSSIKPREEARSAPANGHIVADIREESNATSAPEIFLLYKQNYTRTTIFLRKILEFSM